jgi:hypothetical protein
MIFLRRLWKMTVAHNQYPSAEPSRQQFLGHKCNHRYLASIELIEAAENSWPRSFMSPRCASSAVISKVTLGSPP